MNSVNSQVTFSCDDSLEKWVIVNDDVMGGLSNSSLFISEDCKAVFSGKISLDNNGGFASVRYFPETILKLNNEGDIVLKVKGDGKSYQLRIKLDDNEYYSYINSFKTSGEWEIITLSLNDFYPSYRGRKLANASDVKLNGEIVYVSILIGNKKSEFFNIKLDSISFL